MIIFGVGLYLGKERHSLIVHALISQYLKSIMIYVSQYEMHCCNYRYINYVYIYTEYIITLFIIL